MTWQNSETPKRDRMAESWQFTDANPGKTCASAWNSFLAVDCNVRI